jgi:hypothetical protein
MWPKSYKDYEIDTPLIQEQVSAGHGIIGCEMHDLNGWGECRHIMRQTPPRGLINLWHSRIYPYLKKSTWFKSKKS